MTEEKCLPTEVTTEREGSRDGGRLVVGVLQLENI